MLRALGLLSAFLLQCLCLSSTATPIWSRIDAGPNGSYSTVTDVATHGEGVFTLMTFATGTSDQNNVQVVALSLYGGHLWTYVLPDFSDEWEIPGKIAVSPDGGYIYFTALRKTSPTENALVITKLRRSDKAVIWQRTRPNYDYTNFLHVDGSFVTVGGAQPNSFGGTDASIVRYSASGAPLALARWNRSLSGNASLRGVAMNGTSIYALIQDRSLGRDDAILAKYDYALEEDWSIVALENASSEALAFGPGGDVYISGLSDSDDETFVARVNSSGFVRWQSRYLAYSKGITEFEGRIVTPGDQAVAEGQRMITIPSWGSTSYPTLLGAYDADGKHNVLNSFVNTPSGLLLVGRKDDLTGSRLFITKLRQGERRFTHLQEDNLTIHRVIEAAGGFVIAGTRHNNGTASSEAFVRYFKMTLAPASLTVDQPSVLGGNTTRATVTLEEPAPKGGYVVPLSSSNAAANLSGQLYIPEGQTSYRFSFTTTRVSTTQNVTLTAGTGQTAKTAILALKPYEVQSLTFTPLQHASLFYGGENMRLTVSLNGPAPAAGVTVTFTYGAIFGLPSTLSFANGQTTKTLEGTVPKSSTRRTVSLLAKVYANKIQYMQIEAPVFLSVTPQSVGLVSDVLPLQVKMRGKGHLSQTATFQATSTGWKSKLFSIPIGALEATLNVSTTASAQTVQTVTGTVKVGTVTKPVTGKVTLLGPVTILFPAGKGGTYIQGTIRYKKPATANGTVVVTGGGFNVSFPVVKGTSFSMKSIQVPTGAAGPINLSASYSGVVSGTATFNRLP